MSEGINYTTQYVRLATSYLKQTAYELAKPCNIIASSYEY